MVLEVVGNVRTITTDQLEVGQLLCEGLLQGDCCYRPLDFQADKVDLWMGLRHPNDELPLPHTDFNMNWLLLSKTVLPVTLHLLSIGYDHLRVVRNQRIRPFFMFHTHN